MSIKPAPLLIAMAVIVGVIFWLATQSVTGFLSLDDEHYSAERSREMVLLGFGTVHDNFQPSATKPPLQYWLNALALERISNSLLALRLWPLIFAALTGLALCWLALIVDLRERWLTPFAVLFLFTCPLFLRNARSATLDSGLIFFATLFIVAAQLARDQPRWWILAAGSCWLGSLQKAPLILLLWLVVIGLRAARGKRILRERWLLFSLIGALLLISVWPITQRIFFRLSLADLLRLHEPFAVAARRAGASFFDAPLRLSTTWLCGGFAMAAAAIIPLIDKSAARSRFTELSMICLVAIALSLMSNTREVNYLGPIIPLLCLLLARGVCIFCLRQRNTISVLLSILLGTLSLSGLPLTKSWMDRTRTQQWKNGVARTLGDHAAIAHALTATADGEPAFVIEADNHMLVEDFYLFYGDGHSHLTNVTLADAPNALRGMDFVAISTATDLAVVAPQFRSTQILQSVGDVICWNARR